jgi:DNA gyrase subunit A
MADESEDLTTVASSNGSVPGGTILDMQIEEDLRESYLSYAMSVIVSRALPDVRDGLKPSQRRILLAMNDLNLHSRAKEAKCARIAGDTSGKYHPHGESIVYPTLVRLAQDFNSRYPLIDGQGNFGSIDGLPPAAMRYTEARMSPFADMMLQDLDKETVDSVPNYDDTRQEAVVLPSQFPNMLVNGGQGIAVGMATSIPPHNLTEICNAIVLLIDNPEATFAELLEKVPGPDFPTGGTICGRRGIIEGFKTGRSIITLRAKAEIEESKSGAKIVVTEIPYQQQKMRLVSKIADAVKEDRVTGVRNIQDYSDRHGIRIVIDCKKDADPNIVLNQLWQFTPLQDSFSVIMLALVNGRPRTLPLKSMILEFIAHRVNVIRRRTQYLLRKARERAHVLEGLLIALSSIDEVIHRIRTSKDVPEARERLMGLEVSAELMSRALGDTGFEAFQKIMGAAASYNLTRKQADTILQMQLQRLTALEQDKILKEYGEIRDEITEYERLLSSERNILDVVKADTLALRDKHGDERRTQIIDQAGDVDLEDLITQENVVVTISHGGYIKRMSLGEYRTQGRGGRGVSAGATKEGDFLEDVFIANTHHYLMFFTSRGQCHWLKVYDIPAMSRASQGRAVVNLLNLQPDERIMSRVTVDDFDERFVFMVTKKGLVKKTKLEAYSRPKQGGIIGIALEDGDALIATLLVKEGDEVILSTKTGMAIRFAESDARAMGRDTYGVKGIELDEGDEVVGAVVVRNEATLLTVTEHGYGKRTVFDEYRTQRRGGRGLIDIKTSDRNGSVVAIATVENGDEAMLISTGGQIVRIPVEGINVIGRNTQGVRVMRLDEGDRLTALARIAREDVADQADAEAPALASATADPSVPASEAGESATSPPSADAEAATPTKDD